MLRLKFRQAAAKSRFYLPGLIFLYLVLGVAFPGFAQDKILAIVNKEVITQKELDDFVNFMRIQFSKDYRGRQLEEKVDSIRPDLLKRLIEERLILQEAKKEKIVLPEDRIKDSLSEIRRRYPSEAEFQEDLARQGLTQADVELRIREQMLMYVIVEQKIRAGIIVTPEEITSFYNSNTKEFFLPETRVVEAITLESEELAKSVSYYLKTGQSLEELATRYPMTVNMIEVRDSGELRKEIEGVVFKLGIGEVSQAIKVDDKYYVLRLKNVIPAKQQTLSEAQEKIHAFLFEKKTEERMAKWLDELKKNSYVKILQG